MLLPHSEIFQPIHVLLHTLLNRKPRFPSKVLKRTLNAQCAQIVISQVAGANMDRCSGKQFASLINNTCVGNHLSAANIIFGMRVMICQGNLRNGLYAIFNIDKVKHLLTAVIPVHFSFFQKCAENHVYRAFIYTTGTIHKAYTQRNAVQTVIANQLLTGHFGCPIWIFRMQRNGFMMNKPLVTSKGEWLFPCAIWCDTSGSVPSERHGLENEQFSNVYASTDCGKTITLRGHADIPGRSFDEHMLVEKKDGALWMLVRTFKGIGESFSTDGGYTWTPGRNSHIDGPCSRFFIRRLKSGRLLMINHYNFDQRIDLDDIMNQGNVKSWKGRSHLTAMLSEDDGETWPYTLLLDERNEVSYPDAKEADNGYIYVTYDWERVTQREILMARFTEDDILRGKILSPEGKLRVLVNKALGQPDIH